MKRKLIIYCLYATFIFRMPEVSLAIFIAYLYNRLTFWQVKLNLYMRVGTWK